MSQQSYKAEADLGTGPPRQSGATGGSGADGKPLTRSEAARHASLVRWGKEQPFAARLAAIREARKRHKGKGKAARGGKGKAGKGKKTPAQLATEKEARRLQNRKDALAQMRDKPNDAALAALDA